MPFSCLSRVGQAHRLAIAEKVLAGTHRMERLEMSNATLDQGPDAGHSHKAGGNMDSGKLCAYNHTRECFLGLEVDGADLSPANLKDRMASGTLKSGEGIWLVPFRGLP